MNMYALVEAAETASLDVAIHAASQWTLAARPIVKALFALEDIDAELSQGCDNRSYRDAKLITEKASADLRDMLDDIRSEFLSDQLPPQPRPDADDAAWEARDAFWDAVDEAMPTVDAFVRQMARES